MKLKYLRILALGALILIGTAAHAQTIPSVSPWYVNASNQITQRVANTVIALTGLSDGCLGLSSGILTSTGSACGSGSGGVSSFNTRTGAVTLNSSDVTTALGYTPSSFTYPFPLTGNATSTLTQFNGGLTAYASSTIGNGLLGLTVNGAATTTGRFTINTADATPLVIGNGATNYLTLTANSGNSYLSLGSSGIIALFQQGSQTTFCYNGNPCVIAPNGNNTQIGNNVFIPNTGALEIGSTTAANTALVVQQDFGNTFANLFSISSSTNSAGTVTNPFFTVTNKGSVGVGTSTPGATFSVSGTGLFSGSLTAGSLNIPGTADGCATFLTGVLGSTGSACGSGGSSFGYPFPGNATSTLLTFNGGINVGPSATYQLNNTTVITGSTTLDDYYFGPAGSASYTGTDNTGFGAGALSSISTGSRDTAIGRQAIDGNTTGNDTTAVGFFAGNIGVGEYDDDTFIGAWTNENVGSVFASTTELGYKAGYNNAGSGNTLLGYQTGFNLGSGASNIALGQDVDLPSSTASGQLNIGNLIYGTGAYTGVTPSSIATGGSVGIGTSTPGSLFSIGGVANFTTATSTFYGNGINIPANQCYAVGGVCIGGGTGTNYFTLTGSNLQNNVGNALGINTIPTIAALEVQASSTTGNAFTAWSTTGSNLFSILNNGNVGISTSTPLSKLAISGNASIGADYNVAAPTNGLIVEGNTAIGTTTTLSTDPLTVYGGNITANATNGNEGFVLKRNGGLIGSFFSTTIAGATSPVFQGVNGRTIAFNNSSASSNIVDFADPSGNVLTLMNNNGYFGVATTSNPLNSLVVGASESIGTDYNIAAPTNGLIVEGTVGIGTSTPGSIFSVQGVANFTTATSSFKSTGGINLTNGGCYAVSGTCVGGGGLTIGGLNTQVQYNNAGVLGGISGATTNGTILSLTNPLLGGATLTTSSVNGVTLSSTGSATSYLNATGAYSVPVGTTYTASTGLILTGTAFSVNASQNITTLSNLTTAGFVQTTSGGVLSSAALTSGQVITALGFTPFGGTNPLPIANGGTNATSFATSGNGVYYDGTELATAPATSAVNYPYASSTVMSATKLYASSLSSGNCVQAGAGGLLTTTAGACASALTGTIGQTAYFSGSNVAQGTSTLVFATNSNIGFGASTTPYANFGYVAVSSTTDMNKPLFQIQNNENTAINNSFTIDQWGHVYYDGDQPTFTSCTGVVVTAGSNDAVGEFHTNGGVTNGCVVTFKHPYATGKHIAVSLATEGGTLAPVVAESISVNGFTVTTTGSYNNVNMTYTVTGF